MEIAGAAAIEVKDLRYRWPAAAEDCLQVGSFSVGNGESVFIHGPSGSGKSTLLSLLAGVLVPTRGAVVLLGQALGPMGQGGRDRFRADHIGYIFQQFNLIPHLSVLHNALLPCRVSRRRAQRAGGRGGAETTAGELLASLGIGPELWSRPAVALSVGQQQRVAAARALIGGPELVIADEPTSALDEARRDAFMTLLLGGSRRCGSTLVFVSHDARVATRFDRTVDLARLNRAARELPA